MTRPIQKLKAHEILGCLNGTGYTIVENRRRAIDLAIRAALPGDCVIIAGKGHEDYQIIGKTKTPFSDIEEANRALGNLNT